MGEHSSIHQTEVSQGLTGCSRSGSWFTSNSSRCVIRTKCLLKCLCIVVSPAAAQLAAAILSVFDSVLLSSSPLLSFSLPLLLSSCLLLSSFLLPSSLLLSPPFLLSPPLLLSPHFLLIPGLFMEAGSTLILITVNITVHWSVVFTSVENIHVPPFNITLGYIFEGMTWWQDCPTLAASQEVAHVTF